MRFKPALEGEQFRLPVDVKEVVVAVFRSKMYLDTAILESFRKLGAIRTVDDLDRLCDVVSAKLNRPVDRRDVARRMITLIEHKKIDRSHVNTNLLMDVVRTSPP